MALGFRLSHDKRESHFLAALPFSFLLSPFSFLFSIFFFLKERSAKRERKRKEDGVVTQQREDGQTGSDAAKPLCWMKRAAQC